MTVSPGAVSHVVGRFDAIRDRVALGWAADTAANPRQLALEFWLDDRIVGATTVGIYRPDLEAAGLPGASGFKCRLDINPFREAGRIVTARVASHGEVVLGALAIPPPELGRAWLGRRPRPAPSRLGAPVPFVVILLVDAADDPRTVAAAIASVLDQTDPAWTLFVAGPVPHLAGAGGDCRVRLVRERLFQDALRAALAQAGHGHAILMRAPARLEPEAVARWRAAAQDGADLIYADELLTGRNPEAIERFRLKPAFSHDVHVATPLFTTAFCVAIDTALDVWRYRPGLAFRSLPEFALLLLEVAARVAHVPSVLSRQPIKLAAGAPDPAATAAHLRRIGRPARVGPGDRAGVTNVIPEDRGGKVLVVILTRNHGDLLRSCIDSVRRTTAEGDIDFVVVDHASDEPATRYYLRELARSAGILPHAGPFNFAAMNNRAVREARRPKHAFVLFMNNDIEAIRPGWLERMRGLAGRPDVGAVGATLLFGNGLIQHTGIVMGLYGTADHAHKYFSHPDAHDRDPLGDLSLAVTREYAAVTGACLMMRTDTFLGIGGFDEGFPVDYNDVDLCLRVGALGLRNLVAGNCTLDHHESATRSTKAGASLAAALQRLRTRWGSLIDGGDPFYHPKLSLAEDHAIARLEGDDPIRERRLWPTILPASCARPDALDAAIEARRLPGAAWT